MAHRGRTHRLLIPGAVALACVVVGVVFLFVYALRSALTGNGDAEPFLDKPLPLGGRSYSVGTIIDLPASSSRPATDGSPIRILRPFPPEIVRDPAVVTVIAESPGGSYVAWGDDVGNLFVWRVGRNKLTALTDLRPGRTLDPSHRGAITAIRFLDDEGRFVFSVLVEELNKPGDGGSFTASGEWKFSSVEVDLKGIVR